MFSLSSSTRFCAECTLNKYTYSQNIIIVKPYRKKNNNLMVESKRKGHRTSNQSRMQGSHYGGCDDIGVFSCVDALLGAGSYDCIR